MRNAVTIAFAVVLAALSHAHAAVDIVVDKAKQQMTVTVDGQIEHQWPVSTGRPRYDTPNGQYRALSMEERHVSKEWDDAPMPHSIFFTERGHAIHGSWEVRRLGSPASHGCVRLAPPHAEQLFKLVKAQGLAATSVTLTGDIALAAPALGDRPSRQDAATERPRPKRTAQRPQQALPQVSTDERPPETPALPHADSVAVAPTSSQHVAQRSPRRSAADPYGIRQPQVGYARGENGRLYYVAPRGYVFTNGQRYYPAGQ
jgi:hypothetical protein